MLSRLDLITSKLKVSSTSCYELPSDSYRKLFFCVGLLKLATCSPNDICYL